MIFALWKLLVFDLFVEKLFAQKQENFRFPESKFQNWFCDAHIKMSRQHRQMQHLFRKYTIEFQRTCIICAACFDCCPFRAKTLPGISLWTFAGRAGTSPLWNIARLKFNCLSARRYNYFSLDVAFLRRRNSLFRLLTRNASCRVHKII